MMIDTDNLLLNLEILEPLQEQEIVKPADDGDVSRAIKLTLEHLKTNRRDIIDAVEALAIRVQQGKLNKEIYQCL